MSIPEVHYNTVSPTSEWLAYYSNRSGRFELYVQRLSGGDTHRLTDWTLPREPFSPFLWHPDGHRIYFVSDDSARRDKDVYAITLDGEMSLLQPTTGRCLLWDIDPTGRYLWYHERDDSEWGLYRHDLETNRQIALPRCPTPAHRGGGCSPDTTQIAYNTDETNERSNCDVYLADLDGTNARKLPVGDAGTRTAVHAWHPDSRRLLVSNTTTDQTAYVVYDLTAERVDWLGRGPTRTRPVAFLSEDRFLAVNDYTPVVHHLGGKRRRLMIDGVATFLPTVSDGTVIDETTVVIRRKSETRPYELLRYDIATDDYDLLVDTEWRDVDETAITPPESVTYTTTSGTQISGYMFKSASTPSPAVARVYPSGSATPGFHAGVQLLVDRGVSVLNAGRNSTGVWFPTPSDVVEEFATAGAWLRSRDWIDENQVSVMGYSAGGRHVCRQLVRYPEYWAAGVEFAGRTEDLVEAPGTLSVPLLIIHGEHDDQIPVTEAKRLRDALASAGKVEGVDYEYTIIENMGHRPKTFDEKVKVWKSITNFLDEYLLA